MSRFKVGDEVIFSKGNLKDARGKVVNPYWQISQSEYPEVIIEQEDGTGIFVDIDDVRHAEDPYEYAIQRTVIGGPGRPLIVGDNWSPREEVNERLLSLNTDRHEYKLVKRRKAGRIEDV